MKKTKLLLGSLVAACAFSACSVEEGIEVANPEATSSARPQVNLVLSNPDVDTRLGVNANGQVVFTTSDNLGAVLVDKGYTDAADSKANNIWNNVNWDIVNGHAANNKWVYDADQSAFVTKGTTAVGAWLFYTPYNEAMTTTRNGVEFSFPQIQDAAADKSLAANNNINFHISPITSIDGLEGEKVNVPVKYASVYNYMNIKLAFSGTNAAGVSKVEKILVRAKKSETRTWTETEKVLVNRYWDHRKGQWVEVYEDRTVTKSEEVLTNVAFPSKSVVVNEKLAEAGAVAKLSLKNEAENPVFVGENYKTTPVVYDYADQKVATDIAYAAIASMEPKEFNSNGTVKSWKKSANAADFAGAFTKAAAGAKNYDYLVVDCGEHSKGLAVADGKFSAWMLMPAGVYAAIELEIYTDKGIFVKTIDGNDYYQENIVNGQTTKAPIVLSSQTSNSIANIEKVATVAEANDYLKITDANIELVDDNVVSQTSDLVAFINGIQTAKTYDVYIRVQDEDNYDNNGDAGIANHALVINKSVADAIAAKKAKIGDFQLVFKRYEDNFGADQGAIVVEGTEDASIEISDMTFELNCLIKKGKVTIGADIVSKSPKTIEVAAAADVIVKANKKANCADIVGNFTEIDHLVVKGDVTTDGHVHIAKVSVHAGASLTTKNGEFKGEVNNSGTVTADAAIVFEGLTNNANATVTLNDDATIEVEGINKGTINVNKSLTVAADTDNHNKINIASVAALLVDGEDGAKLLNKVGATIVNNGSMMTNIALEENQINNLGVIEAKAGSTTYITTNSSADETGDTNGITMGTIKMDERKPELSVAMSKQQGYKQYTTSASEFATEDGDKFNKVVFESAANVSAACVANSKGQILNYVVAKADLTLPESIKLQELTFAGNATLTAPKTAGKHATVAKLTIEAGKAVKILTENALDVFAVQTALVDKEYASKTSAKIVNNGSLTVGGMLYTSLTKAQAEATSAGKFYSGNANSYQWEQ